MNESAVTLAGAAGELRGTLINPGLRAPLVVVLRGTAFARPSPDDPGYLGFSRELGDAGFAVLFVSLRGTDDSAGFFSMQGWADDARHHGPRLHAGVRTDRAGGRQRRRGDGLAVRGT
ncbi:MAG: hypothetical protein WCP28_00485 [Actinomycetes bacterium]